MGAVQPSRDFARGEIFRFEDDEAENEERLLRVPTIVGSVHPYEEDTFKDIARPNWL